MSPIAFYKEVKIEVSRVVWPARKETMMTVALVVVLAALSGCFFLMVDAGLYKLVQFILGA